MRAQVALNPMKLPLRFAHALIRQVLATAVGQATGADCSGCVCGRLERRSEQNDRENCCSDPTTNAWRSTSVGHHHSSPRLRVAHCIADRKRSGEGWRWGARQESGANVVLRSSRVAALFWRRIEGQGMRGAMGRVFLAYVLQCADGSYYVGHTDDMAKRVAEHHEGGKCTYTETRRPVQLVWSQEFATRAEALSAELQIKNWNRTKKQALVRGDFQELRRAAKKKDWAAYRQRRQPP